MVGFENFINSTPKQREKMSDSEVFSAGVNIVARKLQSKGARLLQLLPEINSIPSLWVSFRDGASYIVVTVARFPFEAVPPINLLEISERSGLKSHDGFWVGVSLAHEFEAFDPDASEGLPLMKGFGLLSMIGELIPLAELE